MRGRKLDKCMAGTLARAPPHSSVQTVADHNPAVRETAHAAPSMPRWSILVLAINFPMGTLSFRAALPWFP